MIKKFKCCDCGLTFPCVKDAIFSNARHGEYWHTAQGFIAKCPKCGSYARETDCGINSTKDREENTMKVSYKGVAGELIKLERGDSCVEVSLISAFCNPTLGRYLYNLEVWDSEKKCKISFTGISLKDVKFLGGEVAYA